MVMFFNRMRSGKATKMIKSPGFVVVVIILAFITGILGANIATLVVTQITNNIFSSNFVERRVVKIFPDEIFKLTNNARVKNGLSPLERSLKLDEMALRRARTIIENGEWAQQVKENGVSYTKAIKKAHYWNVDSGENLANGQYSSVEVVNGWMNNENYKTNILDKKYKEIGIATYSGQLNGFNTVVTAQIFGGSQPPGYGQDYLKGWAGSLFGLTSVKPGWENIKNFSTTYEANKKDADNIISIIDTRTYRIEKIVARIKSGQWFTAEEKHWTYDDERLYKEQEVIAKRLNAQTWK